MPTVACSGQSRLQEGMVSQFVARTTCSPSLALGSHFPSQCGVSLWKGGRAWNPSTQQIVVPRAAAAAPSATVAQSMTRIADTFAVLKEQGKVCFAEGRN